MDNSLNSNIDKIINITNSFDGVIYSEFIRNYYITNKLLNIKNNNINDICIIFNDFNVLTHYTRILSLNYEVYSNPGSSFSYNLIIKYIDNDITQFKILKLNICINNSIFKNSIINKNISNLDCNLFSLNMNSLHILNMNIYRFPNINLSFDNIYNRFINKKFAFLQMNNINIIENIDSAIKLVKDSWIMDDLYLNKSSIVLFLWKNRYNKNYRTSFTDKDYNNLFGNNNCCICGSDFKDNDIVINTKCNHNFHWECSTNNNDKCGLKYWLEKCSDNCPICRKSYCI
jgi:hypothetical protein